MSPKDINTLLYVITELGGTDYYKAFKILYFAEQKHLVRYGDKILDDYFFAITHGPVPTRTYDVIKDIKSNRIQHEDFSIENSILMVALKQPNLDWLSQSNIECLDESILENKDLGFKTLERKSHGLAWKTAKAKASSNKISPVDLAIEAGASPEMIEYIKFTLENQMYFV